MIVIQSPHPYAWETSLSYLGIQLIRNVSNIYKENYIPFLHKMLNYMYIFAKHDLSWIATFKMFLLPLLFNFFRTFPIPLPNTYIKAIQTSLAHFLWQDKRSRSAHYKLIKHRLAGGSGYVDNADYYNASILVQWKSRSVYPNKMIRGTWRHANTESKFFCGLWVTPFPIVINFYIPLLSKCGGTSISTIRLWYSKSRYLF